MSRRQPLTAAAPASPPSQGPPFMARDRQDILDVLACDITARPVGAPTIDDIRRYTRKTAVSDRILSVTFDSGTASEVAAFVEAERLCCKGIEWHLQPPEPVLIIVASQAQLAVLESLLQPS